ncbi:receptor subunit 1 [Seminavis robusta]|uniref:Receptor subunit 1 n=1 Tax=Seminavis robusta TaxID=568900 RepID=A0A9N8ESU3_9STRA|nr:receptor subunit 1 [Seminavis robusta]|eukprot:Sro1777_g296910.1 receptor subunit 1 (666) ;mRNA; f:783-2780
MLILWVLSVSFICLSTANGVGAAELAAYNMTPATPNHVSLRQDVCGRYQKYDAGEIELKDALSGLSLNPVFTHDIHGVASKYSLETGIDTTNPGILIELLDAVAQRANFTWRDSFAITSTPDAYNMTWRELLVWSIENYDISIHGWAHTVERMEQGVTFTEPWLDASYILIDRRKSLRDTKTIDPFNWTKPFEPAVWGMILLTVLVSALVYQLIEHLSGEREDRSLYQWFSDNLYLSAINFSQNFEYAPNSFGGRIFGVSMTIWALVIVATYTANLASLFVEERIEPVLVDSMEKAVVYGSPVCTFQNTNSDFFIRETYPKAILVPKVDEISMFEALRNGECELAVTFAGSWLLHQVNEEVNPDCDLEWVGDKVKTVKSGWAVIADAGNKCSSLVRQVVNLHLVDIVEEGFLDELWEKYRDLVDDGTCTYESLDDRRRLQQPKSTPPSAKAQNVASATTRHRILKGAGRSASGTEDGVDADTLTLQQMAGTFIVHYGAMAIAVLVSLVAVYAEKKKWFQKEGQVVEKVINRTHGPIIGMPPPLNTYVVRNSDDALDISHVSHNTGNGSRIVRNDTGNYSRQERARFSSENDYMDEPTDVGGTVNRRENQGFNGDFDPAEIVVRMNEMQKALDSQAATLEAQSKTLETQSHMIRQLLMRTIHEHDV